MSKTTKLVDARNEVLRKIGRNVFNLQKMEGMLKLLNAHGNISGDISDLDSIKRQQSESVSRHTMGRLVSAFVQSVYSNQSDSNQENFSETSVSFSFTIEGEADLSSEREKALLSIVEERNRLIHTMLLPFKPNSLASCQELGEVLDAQHEKILPEFEVLRSIIVTFREGRARLAQYIQSDEFKDQLSDSADGA